MADIVLSPSVHWLRRRLIQARADIRRLNDMRHITGHIRHLGNGSDNPWVMVDSDSSLGHSLSMKRRMLMLESKRLSAHIERELDFCRDMSVARESFDADEDRQAEAIEVGEADLNWRLAHQAELHDVEFDDGKVERIGLFRERRRDRVQSAKHGTVSEYQTFGCRCDPCRASATEYAKRKWRRRRDREREDAKRRGECT